MIPDPITVEAQGTRDLRPTALTETYISPAAQRLLGLRMEAQPGAAPAATTPPPSQGDPAAGGTGKDGGGGFNWGLFPDVPDEQKQLLEPHLKGVQGHVTKIEQQYAPFKSVIDSGLSAEDVQGLVALNQSFGQDPMGTWLKLAEDMQANKLLSDDLDLEAVKLVLEGKAEVDDGTGGVETPAGDEPPEPQWARELREEAEARKASETETQQRQTAEQQQKMLAETTAGMKAQLKEAGFTDEQLATPEFDGLLTSSIITAKGNPDVAMKQLLALRDGSIKGLAGKPKDDDLEMPDGPPKTPKRSRGGKEFGKAREGATQFLTRKNQEASQE